MIGEQIEELRVMFWSRTARQALILFAGQILNVLLGVAVAALNTRWLSVRDFGTLNILSAVVLFIAWFFDFGVYHAGSRLVATVRSKVEERKLAGGLAFISLVLGIALTVLIAMVSLFIDGLLHMRIGGMLLLLSPLVAVFPFQLMVTMVLRGNNAIEKLSLYAFGPRLLYLILMIIAWSLIGYSVTMAFGLNLLSLLLVTIGFLIFLKCNFHELSSTLKLIWRETKEYGLKIYYGTLVDNLTNGTDKILISYFVGATPVGLYSAAVMLTTPIALFSKSLATSVFKGFTAVDRIPFRDAMLNFVWLIGASAALLLGSGLLIKLIFTEKYLSIRSFLPLLVLASMFNGANQLYHVFFMAHRRGEIVRNISIISSLINVFGNVVLISLFGAIGAAWSMMATYCVNFLLNLYYYQHVTPSTVVA
ncbi:MAG: oligosaccharide flippase family protein [Bacteroidota bacterium]